MRDQNTEDQQPSDYINACIQHHNAPLRPAENSRDFKYRVRYAVEINENELDKELCVSLAIYI